MNALLLVLALGVAFWVFSIVRKPRKNVQQKDAHMTPSGFHPPRHGNIVAGGDAIGGHSDQV